MTAFDEKLTELEKREADRLLLLDAVYELTNANPGVRSSLADAYQKAGLDDARGALARSYLTSEALLALHEAGAVAITHEGVKEREAVIRGHGRVKTAHFSEPAAHYVVTTVYGHVYGRTQAGTPTSPPRVSHPAGAPAAELSSLISELRAHAEKAPPAVRHETIALVDKLQAQAEAKEPNHGLMKMYAKGLEAFVEFAPVVNQILEAISAVGA